MPAAADHFSALVDRLAVDIEAMPSSAQAMARAAGLSRSQFERVARAVAGESPARFRGRILLERAAYLMIRAWSPTTTSTRPPSVPSRVSTAEACGGRCRG